MIVCALVCSCKSFAVFEKKTSFVFDLRTVLRSYFILVQCYAIARALVMGRVCVCGLSCAGIMSKRLKLG